jgi:hypothetical protein
MYMLSDVSTRPSAVLLALLFLGSHASAATIGFDDNHLQTFIISTTGTYQIVAYGASGGSGFALPLGGGLGAEIGGNFSLIAGDVLDLYVAGAGANGIFDGGGGGGTFVIGPSGDPLVVAAGGGGAGAMVTGGPGLAVATNSNGGLASNVSGGGGGFSGPGGSAGFLLATGGAGYPDLTGGTPTISGTPGGVGGFGGGGGSGNGAGGGGGGYSGGNAGGIAGFNGPQGGMGGGSFDAGLNQILFAGVNSGNGFVQIDRIASPEPGSLALGGFGFMIFAALRSKRTRVVRRAGKDASLERCEPGKLRAVEGMH